MPTYVYQIINPDGTEGDCFEVVQSISEASLTEHPETGQPVRKVFLPPNLGTKHTEGKTKDLLSNENIAKSGLAKYEKDKLTGTYHKVLGDTGPDTIQRPSAGQL
tara:strand:- start:11620 stop:11934 length:315 start_codon:yes stop_codon:yes gene_type:complete